MVAGLQAETEAPTTLPVLFFEGIGEEWDVSADGDFFVTVDVAPRDPPRMFLALNWFEELKRLVPRGR